MQTRQISVVSIYKQRNEDDNLYCRPLVSRAGAGISRFSRQHLSFSQILIQNPALKSNQLFEFAGVSYEIVSSFFF